jgi:hypothetical protein
MLRILLIIVFCVVFKNILSQPLTRKDSIYSYYNRSKEVFAGIINNIYEMKSYTYAENKYIVEFEVTEIYKGKRMEKFITVNDKSIIDNLKVKDEYLVYSEKKKQDDYSGISRISNVRDSSTVDEIKVLYEYLKSRLIKKVKSPVPNYKLVLKGCGC